MFTRTYWEVGLLGRFRSLLSWEFRNLLRFPMLELLVGIAVYLSVLTGYGGGDGESPYSIVRHIARHFHSEVVYLYVPTLFAAVVFASVGIAREIEAGYVKVVVSNPVRRRDLFFVKFAGCFLATLAILGGAILVTMFLQHWSVSMYIISFPAIILSVFVLFVLQTFFVTCVAAAVAVLSRNTAVSFIGSFGILYLPYYMSALVGVKIPLVPPESTALFSFYLCSGVVFWRQYDLVTLLGATVVPVVVALTLLLVSFVYFTRRYDVV